MRSDYIKAIQFMQSSEHFQELRHRLGFCIVGFIFFVVSIFLNSSKIFHMFQKNLLYVKITPTGMSDFLYTLIKLSISFGIFFIIFFLLFQIFLFFLPGLTQQEKNSSLNLIFMSLVLFFVGLLFCKTYIIPATFNFLILYSLNSFEATWKLDTYVDILIAMTIITGISFQIPIIQFLLRYFGIISGKGMLKVSKYVIVLFSLLSAILTPSTDPYPQIILSIAIFSLYILGAFFLQVIKR